MGALEPRSVSQGEPSPVVTLLSAEPTSPAAGSLYAAPAPYSSVVIPPPDAPSCTADAAPAAPTNSAATAAAAVASQSFAAAAVGGTSSSSGATYADPPFVSSEMAAPSSVNPVPSVAAPLSDNRRRSSSPAFAVTCLLQSSPGSSAPPTCAASRITTAEGTSSSPDAASAAAAMAFSSSLPVLLPHYTPLLGQLVLDRCGYSTALLASYCMAERQEEQQQQSVVNSRGHEGGGAREEAVADRAELGRKENIHYGAVTSSNAGGVGAAASFSRRPSHSGAPGEAAGIPEHVPSRMGVSSAPRSGERAGNSRGGWIFRGGGGKGERHDVGDVTVADEVGTAVAGPVGMRSSAVDSVEECKTADMKLEAVGPWTLPEEALLIEPENSEFCGGEAELTNNSNVPSERFLFGNLPVSAEEQAAIDKVLLEVQNRGGYKTLGNECRAAVVAAERSAAAAAAAMVAAAAGSPTPLRTTVNDFPGALSSADTAGAAVPAAGEARAAVPARKNEEVDTCDSGVLSAEECCIHQEKDECQDENTSGNCEWVEQQILRFLYSTAFDVTKTVELLKSSIAFRCTRLPVHLGEVIKEIRDEGVAYWHGRDRALRPLLIIRVEGMQQLQQKKGLKGTEDNDVVTRVIIFSLEFFLRYLCVAGRVETWCILCDCRGTSLSFFPVPLLLRLLSLLQACYRGRLHRLYVLNAPRLFHVLARSILCSLPANSAKKVRIYSNNEDWKAERSRCFARHQLEKKYGGDQPDIVKGWFPYRFYPGPFEPETRPDEIRWNSPAYLHREVSPLVHVGFSMHTSSAAALCKSASISSTNNTSASSGESTGARPSVLRNGCVSAVVQQQSSVLAKSVAHANGGVDEGTSDVEITSRDSVHATRTDMRLPDGNVALWWPAINVLSLPRCTTDWLNTRLAACDDEAWGAAAGAASITSAALSGDAKQSASTGTASSISADAGRPPHRSGGKCVETSENRQLHPPVVPKHDGAATHAASAGAHCTSTQHHAAASFDVSVISAAATGGGGVDGNGAGISTHVCNSRNAQRGSAECREKSFVCNNGGTDAAPAAGGGKGGRRFVIQATTTVQQLREKWRQEVEALAPKCGSNKSTSDAVLSLSCSSTNGSSEASVSPSAEAVTSLSAPCDNSVAVAPSLARAEEEAAPSEREKENEEGAEENKIIAAKHLPEAAGVTAIRNSQGGGGHDADDAQTASAVIVSNSTGGGTNVKEDIAPLVHRKCSLGVNTVKLPKDGGIPEKGGGSHIHTSQEKEKEENNENESSSSSRSSNVSPGTYTNDSSLHPPSAPPRLRPLPSSSTNCVTTPQHDDNIQQHEQHSIVGTAPPSDDGDGDGGERKRGGEVQTTTRSSDQFKVMRKSICRQESRRVLDHHYYYRHHVNDLQLVRGEKEEGGEKEASVAAVSSDVSHINRGASLSALGRHTTCMPCRNATGGEKLKISVSVGESSSSTSSRGGSGSNIALAAPAEEEAEQHGGGVAGEVLKQDVAVVVAAAVEDSEVRERTPEETEMHTSVIIKDTDKEGEEGLMQQQQQGEWQQHQQQQKSHLYSEAELFHDIGESVTASLTSKFPQKNEPQELSRVTLSAAAAAPATEGSDATSKGSASVCIVEGINSRTPRRQQSTNMSSIIGTTTNSSSITVHRHNHNHKHQQHQQHQPQSVNVNAWQVGVNSVEESVIAARPVHEEKKEEEGRRSSNSSSRMSLQQQLLLPCDGDRQAITAVHRATEQDGMAKVGLDISVPTIDIMTVTVPPETAASISVSRDYVHPPISPAAAELTGETRSRRSLLRPAAPSVELAAGSRVKNRKWCAVLSSSRYGSSTAVTAAETHFLPESGEILSADTRRSNRGCGGGFSVTAHSLRTRCYRFCNTNSTTTATDAAICSLSSNSPDMRDSSKVAPCVGDAASVDAGSWSSGGGSRDGLAVHGGGGDSLVCCNGDSGCGGGDSFVCCNGDSGGSGGGAVRLFGNWSTTGDNTFAPDGSGDGDGGGHCEGFVGGCDYGLVRRIDGGGDGDDGDDDRLIKGGDFSDCPVGGGDGGRSSSTSVNSVDPDRTGSFGGRVVGAGNRGGSGLLIRGSGGGSRGGSSGSGSGRSCCFLVRDEGGESDGGHVSGGGRGGGGGGGSDGGGGCPVGDDGGLSPVSSGGGGGDASASVARAGVASAGGGSTSSCSSVSLSFLGTDESGASFSPLDDRGESVAGNPMMSLSRVSRRPPRKPQSPPWRRPSLYFTKVECGGSQQHDNNTVSIPLTANDRTSCTAGYDVVYPDKQRSNEESNIIENAVCPASAVHSSTYKKKVIVENLSATVCRIVETLKAPGEEDKRETRIIQDMEKAPAEKTNQINCSVKEEKEKEDEDEDVVFLLTDSPRNNSRTTSVEGTEDRVCGIRVDWDTPMFISPHKIANEKVQLSSMNTIEGSIMADGLVAGTLHDGGGMNHQACDEGSPVMVVTGAALGDTERSPDDAKSSTVFSNTKSASSYQWWGRRQQHDGSNMEGEHESVLHDGDMHIICRSTGSSTIDDSGSSSMEVHNTSSSRRRLLNEGNISRSNVEANSRRIVRKNPFEKNRDSSRRSFSIMTQGNNRPKRLPPAPTESQWRVQDRGERKTSVTGKTSVITVSGSRSSRATARTTSSTVVLGDGQEILSTNEGESYLSSRKVRSNFSTANTTTALRLPWLEHQQQQEQQQNKGSSQEEGTRRGASSAVLLQVEEERETKMFVVIEDAGDDADVEEKPSGSRKGHHTISLARSYGRKNHTKIQSVCDMRQPGKEMPAKSIFHYRTRRSFSSSSSRADTTTSSRKHKREVAAAHEEQMLHTNGRLQEEQQQQAPQQKEEQQQAPQQKEEQQQEQHEKQGSFDDNHAEHQQQHKKQGSNNTSISSEQREVRSTVFSSAYRDAKFVLKEAVCKKSTPMCVAGGVSVTASSDTHDAANELPYPSHTCTGATSSSSTELLPSSSSSSSSSYAAGETAALAGAVAAPGGRRLSSSYWYMAGSHHHSRRGYLGDQKVVAAKFIMRDKGFARAVHTHTAKGTPARRRGTSISVACLAPGARPADEQTENTLTGKKEKEETSLTRRGGGGAGGRATVVEDRRKFLRRRASDSVHLGCSDKCFLHGVDRLGVDETAAGGTSYRRSHMASFFRRYRQRRTSSGATGSASAKSAPAPPTSVTAAANPSSSNTTTTTTARQDCIERFTIALDVPVTATTTTACAAEGEAPCAIPSVLQKRGRSLSTGEENMTLSGDHPTSTSTNRRARTRRVVHRAVMRAFDFCTVRAPAESGSTNVSAEEGDTQKHVAENELTANGISSVLSHMVPPGGRPLSQYTATSLEPCSARIASCDVNTADYPPIADSSVAEVSPFKTATFASVFDENCQPQEEIIRVPPVQGKTLVEKQPTNKVSQRDYNRQWKKNRKTNSIIADTAPSPPSSDQRTRQLTEIPDTFFVERREQVDPHIDMDKGSCQCLPATAVAFKFAATGVTAAATASIASPEGSSHGTAATVLSPAVAAVDGTLSNDSAAVLCRDESAATRGSCLSGALAANCVVGAAAGAASFTGLGGAGSSSKGEPSHSETESLLQVSRINIVKKVYNRGRRRSKSSTDAAEGSVNLSTSDMIIDVMSDSLGEPSGVVRRAVVEERLSFGVSGQPEMTEDYETEETQSQIQGLPVIQGHTDAELLIPERKISRDLLERVSASQASCTVATPALAGKAALCSADEEEMKMATVSPGAPQARGGKPEKELQLNIASKHHLWLRRRRNVGAWNAEGRHRAVQNSGTEGDEENDEPAQHLKKEEAPENCTEIAAKPGVRNTAVQVADHATHRHESPAEGGASCGGRNRRSRRREVVRPFLMPLHRKKLHSSLESGIISSKVDEDAGTLHTCTAGDAAVAAGLRCTDTKAESSGSNENNAATPGEIQGDADNTMCETWVKNAAAGSSFRGKTGARFPLVAKSDVGQDMVVSSADRGVSDSVIACAFTVPQVKTSTETARGTPPGARAGSQGNDVEIKNRRYSGQHSTNIGSKGEENFLEPAEVTKDGVGAVLSSFSVPAAASGDTCNADVFAIPRDPTAEAITPTSGCPIGVVADGDVVNEDDTQNTVVSDSPSAATETRKRAKLWLLARRLLRQ